MLSVLFWTGCGHQERSLDTPLLVWDTAGAVERYIIPPEAAAEAPRWNLASEPVLEIGQAEGEASRTFGRIAAILTLQSGSIVVADAHANELRFFDDLGRLDAIAGRAGDGPGEFRGLVWLGECAQDSVFAFDFVHDRVSVFSARGEFERSFYLETGATPVYDIPTCSRQGLFVTRAWPSEVDVPLGLYRTSAPISLADRSGRMIDVLGNFPGDERTGVPSGSGPRVFGQSTLIGVSGKNVYVATTDRYEIGVLSLRGIPRTVFGIELPAYPVTDADLTLYSDREIKRRRMSGEGARRLDRSIRDQAPEHFPLLDRLLVALTGNVWVRRYARPTANIHRWDMFKGTGTFLGFLEVPAAFEPLDVDDGLVAGRWTGELNEEYVRLYRIRPSSAAPAHR